MLLDVDLSRDGVAGPGGFPTPSVLEHPVTGIRWLLVGETVLGFDLAAAERAGVAGALRHHGGGWWAISWPPPTTSAGQDGTISTSEWGWFEVDEPPLVPPERPAVERPATNFVHLHAHSEMSPLDGFSTVKEMVAAAVADGQPAIAVTDHGMVSAHPELQAECRKAGIKPIFGIEANLVNDAAVRDPATRNDYWHFILLAQNERGLRNLWAASTESHLRGFYARSRMDWDIMARHSEGLIASTACLRGPLSKIILAGDESGARAMLARMQAIFGDRLYVELHTNQLVEQITLNERLVSLAHDMSLPAIVVADSHYSCIDHHHAHKVWIAAQTDKVLTAEQDLFSGDEHYHISTVEEVRKAIAYLPPNVVEEAIANTVAVADLCDVSIAQRASTPIFHRRHPDGAEEDRRVMIARCEAAWEAKVGAIEEQDVYRQRFEYEVQILSEKRYCGYMLIVADYIARARSRGILVGPGRGSSAGSLVCWLLGITGIDPIKYDLLFERFINPGRTSLPDVDTDFPTSKREVVTQDIIDTWGEDRVVRIGTETRLKNKGVLRDLSRVLKGTVPVPDFMELKAMSAVIENAEVDTAGLGMSWEDLCASEPLMGTFRSQYPEVFALADVMVGRLKSYGRHPAGLVISPDESITDWLPLRSADGQPVTQFPADFIEFLGLVKFDILTVRTLDTIQVAMDLIRNDPVVSELAPDFETWTDEQYDDPVVWDMLCEGDTVGVFQIETAAGTRLTKDFQPRNLFDLSAIQALVRPGPSRAGITHSYLSRRHGREQTTAVLPALEPVLRRTYQLMVYQEDIMAVCQTVAGYTLQEADEVRSILGKKKVDKVAAEGERFRQRAIERGHDPVQVEAIWNQMAEFAKYAFARSHAMSYAFVAYWCAWLKAHFPGHFYTAVLSTADKERIPDFVGALRRLNWRVLPPDVNESGFGFTMSDDRCSIRYGLCSVMGIGEAAASGIVESRPYTGWDDFWERKGKGPNIAHITALARVGAFDSILPRGKRRSDLLAVLEQMGTGKTEVCTFDIPGHPGPNGMSCSFDWANEQRPVGKSGKPLKAKPIPKKCTKACRNYTPINLIRWEAKRPLTDVEVRKIEEELLGTWISCDPFDTISDGIYQPGALGDGLSVHTGSQMLALMHDQARFLQPGQVIPTVLMVGMVAGVRHHRDRNGKDMAFLRVYAKDATVEVTVFSDAWEKYRHDLTIDSLGLYECYVNQRGASLHGWAPMHYPKMEM